MNRYCFSILLIACLAFGQRVSAQAVDPKLAQALEHTLDSMRQLLNINGLLAAIQLPNNAVWAAGSGVSTFSPIDSIGVDHTFETGSTTKTITGMCILQLVDENVLSLEDSLYQWLPRFEHIDTTITIRQLLQHRSGISDILMHPNFQPTISFNTGQLWTAQQAIVQFIQAPEFQPGAGWGYSNTNYLLLGMIIEAATGHTFAEEVKQRFFTPLGLNSFINPAFEAISEPYAHLWLDITGDGQLDDAGDFMTSWVSLFSIIGPAGGYFASPTDLAQWIKTSMSGQLLTPSTWEEATQVVPTSLPLNIGYGLGLMQGEHIGYRALGSLFRKTCLRGFIGCTFILQMPILSIG